MPWQCSANAVGGLPTDAAHTDITVWQTAWPLKKPAHIGLGAKQKFFMDKYWDESH